MWARVGKHERVYALADEDLDRGTEDKTASVHFLRFELDPEMVSDAKGGATLGFGIDHPGYTDRVEPVAETVRTALLADLA